MKDFLITLILKDDTTLGRRFDLFIQTLIILSLFSFSVETLPGLSEELKSFLNLFELISVSIFSIEYILRVILSKKTARFIFSFYGLIDLIAILPFYLSVGIDLRSIRIFRLLRLFRVLKLLKYSKALNKLKNAFLDVKQELVIFLVATLFILYFSSVGIYYFEKAAQPEVFQSVFHSMWWAVATLTTVGYGDVYPITIGGKIFTSFIVLMGIGLVAVPTGLIASALTKVVSQE